MQSFEWIIVILQSKLSGRLRPEPNNMLISPYNTASDRRPPGTGNRLEGEAN